MSPPESLAGMAGPFAVRLRDLLATLESASLLGASEARVRGLGEHLRFACLAMECDEALVALEIESLGRLRVPVVASPEAFVATAHDFLPSGTPFAFLLAGGSGHAAELADGDAMIEPLRPVLSTSPRAGVFVPIRLGGAVVGGAALFSRETALGDRQLDMAERLAEVLSLTVESFRTERLLFELFARALPDLLDDDAATSLRAALEKHVHAMRLVPTYRRRLELATALGKLADRGELEATLASTLLDAVDGYVAQLGGERSGP
jgi:hypothetical protein